MKAEDNGPVAPSRDSGRGGVALLIIDMINCFDFEGAEALRANAAAIVEPILRLRGDVERNGGHVIYVNDNFGEWHSERSRLIERALAGGNDVAGRLAPKEQDYFVIKPQFSGFYSTNLPVLLPKLGASRLILAGVATDICVLFTAGDAHMRDYDLWVPEDAVATEEDERGAWALEIMRNSMGARTDSTEAFSIGEWIAARDAAEAQEPQPD